MKMFYKFQIKIIYCKHSRNKIKLIKNSIAYNDDFTNILRVTAPNDCAK